MRLTALLAPCFALLAATACGGKSSTSTTPGAPVAVRVSAVEPHNGSPAGGQPITLRGAGFMSESRAIEVYFGDTPANIITVPSDTEVQVEAPSGAAGATVDVRVVFEPGGEQTLPGAFTFDAN